MFDLREEDTSPSLPSRPPCVGTVVWARVEPWPYWPAVTVCREWAVEQLAAELVPNLPPASETNCVVQFFNYDDYIDVVEAKHVQEFCENVSLLRKADKHTEDVKRAAQEAIWWLLQQGKGNKTQLLALRDRRFRRVLNSAGVRLEDKPVEESKPSAQQVQTVVVPKTSKPTSVPEVVELCSSGNENSQRSSSSYDVEKAYVSKRPIRKARPTKKLADTSSDSDDALSDTSNRLPYKPPHRPERKVLKKKKTSIEKKKDLFSHKYMDGHDDNDRPMVDDDDPLPDADRAPLAPDYQSLLFGGVSKNPSPASNLPTPVPRRFKHRVSTPDRETEKQLREKCKENQSFEKSGSKKEKDVSWEKGESQAGKEVKEKKKAIRPRSSMKSAQSAPRIAATLISAKCSTKNRAHQVPNSFKESDERFRRMREDARSEERPRKRQARPNMRPSSRVKGVNINGVGWKTTNVPKRTYPIPLAPLVSVGGYDSEESYVMSEGNGDNFQISSSDTGTNYKAAELMKRSKELSQGLDELKVERQKFERKHRELVSKEEAIEGKLVELNAQLAELMKEYKK